LKVIEAKGSHSEIGKQLGEQCKDTAQRLKEQFRERWDRLRVDKGDAIVYSTKFLPYAQNFYSNYINEMRGYAYASDIPFAEVFAWFCYDPPPKGCTDFVLNRHMTADGHVYMCHNEDYDVQEEEYAVLVRVVPDDEPSFLAMTYGGIWFNAGVNELGIGVAGNGLTHTDSRIGIPGDFAFRKTLSARTIGDAMNYSTPQNRSFSYCNVICDDEGEMYSMEGSATDFAAIYSDRFLVHTNHYLSPKMEKYEGAFNTGTDRSPGSSSDSIIRYNKAVSLIKEHELSLDDMKWILSDHHNMPWSICRHVDHSLPEEEQSKTVFSEIIDLTKRSIYVCGGNPCEGKYVKHEL